MHLRKRSRRGGRGRGREADEGRSLTGGLAAAEINPKRSGSLQVTGIHSAIKKQLPRMSLALLQLRLCAPNVEGLGLIPDQGTRRSHRLQLRDSACRN